MTGKLPRLISIPIRAAAEAVAQTVFIPEAASAYEVVEVREAHTVLGTDNGAVTADLVKCTGTQTPAQGSTVLGSTFDLKATINTVVSKTVRNGGLIASRDARTIHAGQRLCLVVTGTPTAYAGGMFNVLLKQVRVPYNR